MSLIKLHMTCNDCNFNSTYSFSLIRHSDYRVDCERCDNFLIPTKTTLVREYQDSYDSFAAKNGFSRVSFYEGLEVWLRIHSKKVKPQRRTKFKIDIDGSKHCLSKIEHMIPKTYRANLALRGETAHTELCELLNKKPEYDFLIYSNAKHIVYVFYYEKSSIPVRQKDFSLCYKRSHSLRMNRAPQYYNYPVLESLQFYS